MQQMEDFHFCE